MFHKHKQFIADYQNSVSDKIRVVMNKALCLNVIVGFAMEIEQFDNRNHTIN